MGFFNNLRHGVSSRETIDSKPLEFKQFGVTIISTNREMTYLLDSTVLIDILNDRNGRPQFLAQLSHQDILSNSTP